jgi:endonuclease III
MKAALDLHSHTAIHRIIQDAAKAVDMARKEDPTALQEISDSTDGDPFRVLIATVLSHRTKDPVTALASSRLFQRFPDVKSLASANTRTVSRLIKPVGFYPTKARTVKKISRILLDKYGGKVPENMDQLLELPSVGRKTANCVFVYGFKTPAIPVDTHVHRIFNRIGVVETKTPDETEKELTRLADRKDWLPLNEVFVKFGQLVCRPIGPHCSDCPLNDRCKYYETDYLPRSIKKTTKNASKRAKTARKSHIPRLTLGKVRL